MNLTEYDISHPYTAVVASTERITPEDTDEVRHIVLNISNATFNYLEGQSIGVMVPGPHPYGNQEHMRLYSIANARQGEEKNMAELSICVRRCFYIDEVSGERHPGIASNYLCDLKSGEPVEIVGPYGRQFLPPRDPSCNLLMIGVGTGIAPFRAFLKHIYSERGDWQGHVEYLQFLSLSRELDDGHIEGAVAALLSRTEPVTLEGLRDALGIKPERPVVAAFEPDLSGYDRFVKEVQCG